MAVELLLSSGLKDPAEGFPRGGALWGGGTFQLPFEAYGSKINITSIKLYMGRLNSPGTITVSIRSTSALNVIDGVDLFSGTTSGNTLPSLTWPVTQWAGEGEWREITFANPTEITFDPLDTLSFVFRAPAGDWDGSSSSNVFYDSMGSVIVGKLFFSTDSGSFFYDAAGTTPWCFELWGEVIPPALPEKAITPGPTTGNEEVELSQETLTWVDGGLGDANEADTFNIYYGTSPGDLTLVAANQVAGEATNSFTIWGIADGSPYDYAVTRYWRIDSTRTYIGTTTGDEWSFTTLSEGYVPPYPPPRPDPYDPDVGGGGSYATNLLVIGHKVLYYRET